MQFPRHCSGTSGKPLNPAHKANSKALVDVAGKPMIQWILDALSAGQIRVIMSSSARPDRKKRAGM